jgi:hypothetical protein
MRHSIVAALMILAPISAQAQETGYVEASLGGSFTSTVKTKTYTFVVPPDTAIGHAELNYGNEFVAGAEIGMAGFDDGGNWRAGIGYDYTRLNLDSITVVGQVNGVPGSSTFDSSLVRSAGLNFDNSVHLVMGNLYYNLPPLNENLRAYLGFGAGVRSSNTQTLNLPCRRPQAFGSRLDRHHISGYVIGSIG